MGSQKFVLVPIIVSLDNHMKQNARLKLTIVLPLSFTAAILECQGGQVDWDILILDGGANIFDNFHIKVFFYKTQRVFPKQSVIIYKSSTNYIHI